MIGKTDSLRAGAGFLARLIRSVTGPFRASPAVYRPEKHYMRGSGPKSERPAAKANGRTPKAT